MRTQLRNTLMITAVLGTLGVNAQNRYQRVHNKMLDEAKVLLQNGEYVEAGKLYARLIPVDTNFAEPHYDYGKCIIGSYNNWTKAVPYFERAAQLGHTEAKFELAKCRHLAHRFDEAIELYKEYKTIYYRVVDDKEVERAIASSEYAKERVAHPLDVQITNMGSSVNSESHDYSPLVKADGSQIYFTSRRNGSTGGLKDLNGQAFEDIYTSSLIDGKWSNAKNVGAPLNTATQDATVGLTADGNSMIIYRTTKNLTGGDLYLSKREKDGKWGVPNMFTEAVNTQYQEASAAVNSDASIIYFVSDMPGGYGGRDIYRIKRLPTGDWSLPLNMGPTVNTRYDEDAPFLHSNDESLFFASNGHRTMGGFDVFRTVLLDADKNIWSEPENMGYPFNTVNDDIFFSLSQDGRVGYFSSERQGGFGRQDIYQVIFPVSQVHPLIVKGRILTTGSAAIHATVTMTDKRTGELNGIYRSNRKDGRYMMVLAPGHQYEMTVEADGFAAQVSDISFNPSDPKVEQVMDIRMMTQDEASLRSEND